MKSGAISIDRYAGGEPAEQFDFLYENFSILQELLKDYREELIMEVIEQKAYNRRSQNGEMIRESHLEHWILCIVFCIRHFSWQ